MNVFRVTWRQDFTKHEETLIAPGTSEIDAIRAYVEKVEERGTSDVRLWRAEWVGVLPNR